MPDILTETQYAARGLLRNRDFATTAVLALSLGIATNTAIFSVANKVLLDPLPYPEPDRLVQLITTSPLGNQCVVSIPKYGIWRDHVHSFESMAAYDFSGPAVNLSATDMPRPLETARVSSNYFHLFGANVLTGRTFSNQDDRPGASCVAVISEDLWHGKFDARPDLIGTNISLDQKPCKLIGVLAAGFTAQKSVDIWLPLQADPINADHMNRVQVTARLKPGVTLEMGAVDVKKTMQWFWPQYPYAPLLYNEQFTAIPLRDALVGDVRPALLLLAGAVAFVLLIACANAGSLLLARATRRATEIAVRSALGATRSHIMRQLLAESLLLGCASAAAGLVLGFGGVRVMLLLSPTDLPRVGANGSTITLDWRVFLFTIIVSLAAGILCGLLPALSASRVDVTTLVSQTQLESGMAFRRGGMRSLLVISQVALALILLTGAGLLIRTFVGARTANHGFDEQHVLTVQMSLNSPFFERTDQTTELLRSVEKRMKQISGVTAVATTSTLPLEPSLMLPFTIAGHDQTLVGRYHGAAAWRSVSPDYFAALRIRLLRGRQFTNADTLKSTRVVLINRFMMRKFWPEVGANPIGEFMTIGKGIRDDLEDMPRQIIGIVDDVREAGLNREPMMYVPVAQVPNGMTAWSHRVLPITWIVRATDDRVSQGGIEHTLQAATGLPLGRVRTMRQLMAASSSRQQFYIVLLSVFGIVALVLASVGLYGVMAYSVQQRRREIGLRMALGAAPYDVCRMVVWQGLRLAVIGIAVGIPAALALTRAMVSMIFGVNPADPAVLTGVPVLLALVALIAAYSPSVRAVEVDPCESLRS